MKLKKSLLTRLLDADWGVIHLFGRFYLVKKYSAATKGLRGKIWTIDYLEKSSMSGVFDRNGRELKIGDKVKLFNQIGRIRFNNGAYIIVFNELINWDNINRERQLVVGHIIKPRFCCHNYDVSLFELLSNFKCAENICTVVERIDEKGVK